MDALDYAADEFRSPTRSTVALLSLLMHRPELLQPVLKQAGCTGKMGMHLEYQMPVRKGIGNPSHTDLMVRAAGGTLAIEAKWTEPRYESVEKWFSKGKSRQNKELVLRGWLEMIQPYASKRLTIDGVSSLVYQMIHRTASACAEADNASLAYLHFHAHGPAEPKNVAHAREDLQNLWLALGKPAKLPIYFVPVGMRPTPAYNKIAGLKKGLPETGDAVKRALRGAPLFDFEKPKMERIGFPRE